jgi:hypothetical protein
MKESVLVKVSCVVLSGIAISSVVMWLMFAPM